MEKINENNVNISDREPLLIFCFDSVSVKDKVTFDSCMVQGVQVTYWMDDYEDLEEKVNGMFDILFEEVMKDRAKVGDKMVN
jgi:hypothetical protein